MKSTLSFRSTRRRSADHASLHVAASHAPTPAALTGPLSRRVVLAAGAISAGALVVGGAGTARASASTVRSPGLPPSAPAGSLAAAGTDASVRTLSPADRQIASRFSWGLSEALVAEVQDAGGGLAWFEDQLDPASIPDPVGDDVDTWWPRMWWSPQKLAARELVQPIANEIQGDHARWTLIRRMSSSRQLLEVMADFWENLLHVPAPSNKCYPYRVQYDLMIRANALGTFENLLKAAVLHPAMGCYLDNAQSTNTAPNENLGRELLELHTIGRDSLYTEDDVKNSAYILTGYLVDIRDTWIAAYSATDHWVGPVKVLEFTDPNGVKDGQAVTDRYLSFLARDSRTATRLARRLAVRFAGDLPTDALVSAVAQAYLDSQTDIKTTLRALVQHPDFQNGQGKIRTPVEDMCNTYRAMQITVQKPAGRDRTGALLIECARIGQRPFDWPRPDGFPDTDDSWASGGRMLGSFLIHKHAAQAIYPKGLTFQPLKYWLPPLPERFDVLVDHVCRRILNMPSTPELLDAASKAVDVAPGDTVESEDRLVNNRLSDLYLALLDSPQHMIR